jgi:hypothetical protein
MSDQPGIPAITVFPPFNPAPRQSDPAPRPVQDEAPVVPAETPSAPAPQSWDSAAPASPMPWDFEAPVPEPSAPADTGAAAPAAETSPERAFADEDEEADEHGDAPVSEDEDLPWLEVPTPRQQPGEAAQPEIRAEDRPNFADWMRTVDQDAAPEAEATPVEDLAADEAEDAWTDGVVEAEGGWKPESEAGAPAWEAPAGDAAESWMAPEPDLEVPEPELYDLPEVSATESADAASAEVGWELPAAAPVDAPSDAPDAPGPVAENPFAAVAERLEQIAEALRRDPQGFATGAAAADDPLAQLVAGFVLGYQAARAGS